MDDKRSVIICSNGVFMAISTIAITARLLTRAFLIKLVGVDDILIAVAFILSLVYSSLIILSAKYGEGLHIQYLKLENVPAYTMVMILQGFFYYLCQMFIKLSYLAFYLRLSPNKKFRGIVYISMVLVSAYAIGSSVASCLMCMPLSKLWNPNMPGVCFNITAFQLSATTINVLLDIVVFVLPIPVFWGLRLPKRQRISLVSIFGVGSVVLLASIFRLRYLVTLLTTPSYRSDNTWNTVDAVVWSSVEIHLALLISCTAAFKALIQQYLPGILGSYGATRPSRNRHTYHRSAGDAYPLQSRSDCGSKVRTTVSANPDRAKVNGSQDYIMGLGEEIRCETNISIHSASIKGVDGVIGSHIM